MNVASLVFALLAFCLSLHGKSVVAFGVIFVLQDFPIKRKETKHSGGSEGEKAVERISLLR